MKAKGYAYAVIGNAGNPGFYEKTVNTVTIEGSCPGIYPEPLKPLKEKKDQQKNDVATLKDKTM